MRVHVDGEIFEVQQDDGRVDAVWISGPNGGYGFSAQASAKTVSEDELTDLIRSFLGQVDPDTGYIS